MGLDIDLDAFKKMSAKDRDELIYKNLVNIRGKLGSYNFNKKIQYVWLTALTSILTFRRFIPF